MPLGWDREATGTTSSRDPEPRVLRAARLRHQLLGVPARLIRHGRPSTCGCRPATIALLAVLARIRQLDICGLTGRCHIPTTRTTASPDPERAPKTSAARGTYPSGRPLLRRVGRNAGLSRGSGRPVTSAPPRLERCSTAVVVDPNEGLDGRAVEGERELVGGRWCAGAVTAGRWRSAWRRRRGPGARWCSCRRASRPGRGRPRRPALRALGSPRSRRRRRCRRRRATSRCCLSRRSRSRGSARRRLSAGESQSHTGDTPTNAQMSAAVVLGQIAGEVLGRPRGSWGVRHATVVRGRWLSRCSTTARSSRPCGEGGRPWGSTGAAPVSSSLARCRGLVG